MFIFPKKKKPGENFPPRGGFFFGAPTWGGGGGGGGTSFSIPGLSGRFGQGKPIWPKNEIAIRSVLKFVFAPKFSRKIQNITFHPGRGIGAFGYKNFAWFFAKGGGGGKKARGSLDTKKQKNQSFEHAERRFFEKPHPPVSGGGGKKHRAAKIGGREKKEKREGTKKGGGGKNCDGSSWNLIVGEGMGTSETEKPKGVEKTFKKTGKKAGEKIFKRGLRASATGVQLFFSGQETNKTGRGGQRPNKNLLPPTGGGKKKKKLGAALPGNFVFPTWHGEGVKNFG